MSDRARGTRRLRWKPAAIIIALEVIALLALHHREWVESYIAAYATAFVMVVFTLVLLVWFAFFSGLSVKTRGTGVIAFAMLGFLAAMILKLTTRVDGTISGVGVPRLVWKWTPRPGAGLENAPVVAAGAAPVDLAATPQDFPEFLGPGRQNAVNGPGLSRDWSASPPRQLWRQPIGLGWSAFAVVGPFAVTQEQRGASELTVCYEVASGKARWEHAHEGARFSEWQGGDGPRATPTIFQGRVYVMGATGFLDCLDGATGKPLWSRNVLEDSHSGNLTYGKSCSPLIVDDLVVVTGGSRGPSLLAYHKSDGSLAWTGGNETPGYASPVFATLAGAKQILTINSDSAAAHDPADGRLLWRYDWPGSMPKDVQPVPLDGDRVLISAGYGIGTTVLQLRNENGQFSVQPLWTSRHLKPKLSNVVVHGNYVYGLDDGILTCLDLATGKRMWRGDSYGFGQLLGVGDLLLIQSEPGDVALVEASPNAFHEIARFAAISGKTWQGPALSGHHLLVRNDHEAACYELP